jgi:cobalt-zinc-cadmium efflux system protein
MVGVAAGGLVVNLLGLWILRGGREESLNVRGAWLHVLADTLGSVQAIVAGILITTLGWYWVDPVASVLIAMLVVISAWSLLREAVHVLLEGAPAGIDTDEVESSMLGLEGVVGVHDLHVWTITSGFVALSAHIVVEPETDHDVLWRVREMLRDRFDIGHTTIQVEATPDPQATPVHFRPPRR